MFKMSKLWTEDITQLVAFNKGFWPNSGMITTDNLNAITRLGIVASLLIALFHPSLGTAVFVLVVVIVTAVYYGTKTVSREGYEDCVVGTADQIFRPIDDRSSFNEFTDKRFCNDLEPIHFDEEYFSRNQYLVGCPNPKTRIPPIVVPPSHELSFWKASDLTTHSAVNDGYSYDAYAAGYVGPAYDFSKGYAGYAEPLVRREDYRPPLCSECVRAPCVCKSPLTRSDFITTQTIQPGVYEQSDYTEPINSNIGISYTKQFDPTRITLDEHGLKYSAMPDVMPPDEFPQYPSPMNNYPSGRGGLLFDDGNGGCCNNRRRGRSTSCAVTSFSGNGCGLYSPETRNPILPSFYVGNNPVYDYYTKHCRHSRYMPNDNDDNNNTPHYVLMTNDENRNKTLLKENFVDNDRQDNNDNSGIRIENESEIYDPRFTGYGPTDRGYIDPTTGQPRFFYDDINSVKMPNFISRNDVDIYPWAPQYGTGYNGNSSVNGISYGDGYKRLAENAFADATIQFRTEMQERLMRKRNAELWQRRFAPIHTMG